MGTIYGIPCALSGRAAREVVRGVLASIRGRDPKDFQRLRRVVTDIRPLSAAQTTDGTLGEWQEFQPTDDPATWGYGSGDETPGVVWVDEGLPTWVFGATLAHEFGHACTTGDDLEYANAPDDEWAEEASADRYAYKWGFGRAIGRTRRLGPRNRLHHPPGPGATVRIRSGRGRWVAYRITRRFRFVRVGA